jgi:hypothetical protein
MFRKALLLVAMLALCHSSLSLAATAERLTSPPSHLLAGGGDCPGLGRGLARGVTLAVLSCRSVETVGPIGYETILSLERMQLGRGEDSGYRELYTAPRLIYVEQGTIAVLDGSGRVIGTYGPGMQAAIPEEVNGDLYAIRNETAETATVLQAFVSYLTFAGGVPSPDVPKVGFSDGSELFRTWLNFTPEEPATIFLAQMTYEPGSAFGPYTHPGPIGFIGDTDGSLAIEPYPASNDGTCQTLERGCSVVFPSDVPHRESNPGDSPVTALIVGIIAADEEPFSTSGSLLEIHAARCPANAMGGIFEACHGHGEERMLFRVDNSGAYQHAGATAIETSPGPGIVRFHNLAPGRYNVSGIKLPPDPTADPIYVYCSDNSPPSPDGGPVLIDRSGPQDMTLSLDVPADTHVVCDWYLGIPD